VRAGRVRAPLRLLLLVLAGALGSCAAEISLRDLDDLARSTGSRTVLLEDDVSLYSPYDGGYTRALLSKVQAQRADVFALFGVHTDEPTFVWFRENPDLGVDVELEGDRLRVRSVSTPSRGDVLGRSQGNAMIVEVAPPNTLTLADGRTVTGVLELPDLDGTIRHELAHVASTLLGVRGRTWIREGIAHAVEWIPIEDGHFRLDPPPGPLLDAAAVPRERRSVDALLRWEHGDPPTERDLVLRQLALSLVVFAAERQDSPSFGERLLLVDALRVSELRALQPAWSAWLDALSAGRVAPRTVSRLTRGCPRRKPAREDECGGVSRRRHCV
jgi:hypothetical protein